MVSYRGLRALLPILALAALFLAVACDDDGAGPEQTGDGTAPRLEGTADPEQTPDVTAPADGDGSGSGENGDRTAPAGDGSGSGSGENGGLPRRQATPVLEGDAAELAGLLRAGLRATYRVTYVTSSPEGERADSYVVYNEPPRTRIDTMPADPSEPRSTLIAEEDGTVINCLELARGWRCSEIELGESILLTAGPVVHPDSEDLAFYDVAESVGQTTAGQRTRCFSLRAPEETTRADARYCVTRAGVPLYASADLGEVVTRAFSTEVSDGDFTPPAELSG